MRCQNCGVAASEHASTCEFCGHSLVDQSSASVSGGSGSAQVEPPPFPESMSVTGETSSDPDNPYASMNTASLGYAQAPVSDIPNHLPLSIISAVMTLCCCCIPLGIIPVIFSAQVNTKIANGDFIGAKRDSDNAKLWAWIFIGVALAVFFLQMISRVVMLGMSSLEGG
jgi:Interferon-induced transmembrane protein